MKIFPKAAFAIPLVLFGLPAAHAQSFGNSYFFGDSLTDCCIITKTTNSKAPNWADQLPLAIGSNFTATSRTNLAISGAQSGLFNTVPAFDALAGYPTGFLAQVGRFSQQGLTVTPRDIVGIWIGTNDLHPSAIPPQASSNPRQPIGAQPPVATLTNYIVGNIRSGINTLVGLGVRNIVLVAPFDAAAHDSYRNYKVDSNTRTLAKNYSEDLLKVLSKTYTPGVNTYFLDTLTLLRRVQASPSLYGFDHFTAIDNCVDNNCERLPLAQQNRYVFNDYIHTTSGFDQLMVKYIANTINARTSLPAQGDLGQAVGTSFSGILLNRLDAHRDLNTPPVVSGTYTADLPGRSVTPSAIPIMVGSPVSLFAEGSYASIGRSARATPNGPTNPSLDSDFVGVTTGIEYRVTPNLLIGAAFNYFNTSVDLRGSSNARLDLDSYQGGVFASYNQRNFFVDGALTYGANNYGLSRPGVIDTLTAAPTGNTFTAAGKIGYLFDYGSLRVGPIAELTYANVRVGGYSERGDSLLTLGLRQQSFDGLTGGAGLQIRSTLPIFGGQISPFVNLTAQHDFLDGVRTITSFSTNAPALLINTQAGRRGDDLYGKVAGGLAMDLGNGLNGVVSGSATFGRAYGDDYLVSAGLRYRF